MYNIEEIMEMWKKDSEIDRLKLDESSRVTPNLHAKYLEMLTKTKLEKKFLEGQLDVMFKNKWLYYSGKMDVDQVRKLGWDPDPTNGLRVLKGDMDYFYRSDSDMQKLNSKIDLAQAIIETLEEIINNLRWRHSTIKNMIDWHRFTNGA
jgi:hypothetical protein